MTGAAVGLLWAACVGEGDPPAVTLEDLFGRTYIREVSLSPDGRRALVFAVDGDPGVPAQLVVHDFADDGSSTRSAYELPADAWSDVVWDPRTGGAAFLRGAPPRTEVWVFGGALAGSGEAPPRLLLPPGDSGAIFKLFERPVQGAESAAGGTSGPPPRELLALYTNNVGRREAVLRRIDVAEGRWGEEVCRLGTLTVREAAIDAAGRWLALVATELPTFAVQGEPLDLYLIELDGLSLRRLTHGEAQIARPAFSPDGSRLVVTWQAARSALLTAKRDLAFFDLDEAGSLGDCVVQVVTTPLDVSVGDGIFGAVEPLQFVAATTLLVSTQQGLGDHVLEVTLPPVPEGMGAPADAKLRWCTEGSWVRLSVAREARRLVAIDSAPSRPEQVVVADWPSFRARPLEAPNAELAARGLARVSTARFRGSDELPMEGLLLLPPTGEGPFPTIILLHGGSSGRHTLRFNDSFAQAYAGLGYAVFLPNLRGSSGYTVEFNGANQGDFGGRERLDLECAVDELVERRVADPARLFLLGHSYGGYLAQMALVGSTRYAAACAAAGVSDWIRFFRSSDLGGLAVIGFGGTPDQREELYRERSPLLRVDEITTPLLLVHGARDARVPVEQSELLHAELRRRGVPSELMEIPGQGHVLRGRELVAQWIRATDDWFRRHGAAAAAPPSPSSVGPGDR